MSQEVSLSHDPEKGQVVTLQCACQYRIVLLHATILCLKHKDTLGTGDM